MSIYPPVESQEEIHAANTSVSSWHNCPCEVCRTRQRVAGKPVAQFALTGTLRIHEAKVFPHDDYGQVVEGSGRIIYCTNEQASYARTLLAANMFVTVTLDAKGNVVKVS